MKPSLFACATLECISLTLSITGAEGCGAEALEPEALDAGALDAEAFEAPSLEGNVTVKPSTFDKSCKKTSGFQISTLS